MSKSIRVKLKERSYDIIIEYNALNKASDHLNNFISNRKCFIVSDSNVFPLYGREVISAVFKASGINPDYYVFDAGEKSKNLQTVENIYHAVLKSELDRSSVIIALGGGVVGDIAGFVAATYMRGIDYIQIPTTLLSMVDSSVGGKTGVDMPEGKNLIGAFWQPKLVLIDNSVLKTLPSREVKGGLAEVIKYGVIFDLIFFDKINDNIEYINSMDAEFYSYLISSCCRLKAEIVAKDEEEHGLRAILNYGHTFGHAIEKIAGFGAYIHGEAISVGMLMAGELACQLNMMDRDQLNKIIAVLKKLDMCVKAEGITGAAMLKAMKSDKKTKRDNVCFILPRDIGNVEIISGVDRNLVIKAIKKFS